MRIIGVDLHTRQQSVAMLDPDTGELIEKILPHEGDEAREFYSALPGLVLVGIEATGSMPWFLKLLEELKIECRVGMQYMQTVKNYSYLSATMGSTFIARRAGM
jgi:hypothetical protein